MSSLLLIHPDPFQMLMLRMLLRAEYEEVLSFSHPNDSWDVLKS